MELYAVAVLIIAAVLFALCRGKRKAKKDKGPESIVLKENDSETSSEEMVNAPTEFPVYWFAESGNKVEGVAKMAQGLQVFDGNGKIILDLTDGLTKYLGEFETGTSEGSIENEELTEHFWVHPIILTQIPTADYDNTWHAPKFSVSGHTLRWKYDGADRRINCKCFYGVY